jgi:hypothetical protein
MEERRYRSSRKRKTEAEVAELFKNAPIMRKPGDLANPNLFPDDAEFEEFLASIRADRQRGLIYPP